VPGARSWQLAFGIALSGALLLMIMAAERAAAFGIEDVAKRARRLASQSYREPDHNQPAWLREITYDQWRDIRFRPNRSLWLDKNLPFTVQFFHPGFFYDRSVRVNEIVGKDVKAVPFAPDLFDYGKNEFGSRVPQDLGFAGIRIHYPIKNPNYRDEVIVFLGASYFRAVGRDQAYGLSARGLAIDTASPSGESSRGSASSGWCGQRPTAQELTIYALLDSPSAAGAYKFVIAPGPETRVDIEMQIFPRTEIKKLGVGPMTSMFLRGENGDGPIDDYRPEGARLGRAPDRGAQRRVAVAAARESARAERLVVLDRRAARLRTAPARPQPRPLPGLRGAPGPAAEHLDRAEGRLGGRPRRAGRDPRPPRTPTTTSWPIGCPMRWWLRKRPVILAYSMYWYGEDHSRPPAGWTSSTRRDKGTLERVAPLVVDFEGKQLGKIPPESVVEGVVTAAAHGQSGAVRGPPSWSSSR
jgi:glucans biosynthesis protein